jgi:alkylation response protein AidB-like acyl-CoA dehydrogenase
LLVNALGTAVQKQDLLAPMIAGDLLLTTAYAEPQAAEQSRLFKTTAARIGDEWVLHGEKAFVADLSSVDVVLILARLRAISDHAGWGLFAVRRGILGFGGVRQTDAFGATPLYEIKLDGLKLPLDALLGGIEAATRTLAVFEDTIQKATALQCMEMAGGIAGALKLTVAYLKEREQFGKPLGANQAVQHLLANIGISLDGARVAALKALFLAVNNRQEAGRAVSMAKVVLGEAYVNATITCGQLWGAMGYSRETGLYLWAERAKVTDAWYGTRASHLKRYAKQLELVG